MGGQITRPVTDEEKNIVTCFLIYHTERKGSKPKYTYVVLEDILRKLLALLNFIVCL